MTNPTSATPHLAGVYAVQPHRWMVESLPRTDRPGEEASELVPTLVLTRLPRRKELRYRQIEPAKPLPAVRAHDSVGDRLLLEGKVAINDLTIRNFWVLYAEDLAQDGDTTFTRADGSSLSFRMSDLLRAHASEVAAAITDVHLIRVRMRGLHPDLHGLGWMPFEEAAALVSRCCPWFELAGDGVLVDRGAPADTPAPSTRS